MPDEEKKIRKQCSSTPSTQEKKEFLSVVVLNKRRREVQDSVETISNTVLVCVNKEYL